MGLSAGNGSWIQEKEPQLAHAISPGLAVLMNQPRVRGAARSVVGAFACVTANVVRAYVHAYAGESRTVNRDHDHKGKQLFNSTSGCNTQQILLYVKTANM